MKCSDLLRPSRRASLPSLGDTRRCGGRFAPVSPAAGCGPGVRLFRSPFRKPTPGDDSGSPRFLGNPCVPMPCSPTPAGPTRQAFRRCRCSPRYVHNEGSHENPSFGAQSHGLGTRCLRFVRCLATRDARLASRCWPLCGAGMVTRWIPLKGFRFASYISSPLPKLCLAQGQPRLNRSLVSLLPGHCNRGVVKLLHAPEAGRRPTGTARGSDACRDDSLCGRWLAASRRLKERIG
jgi:hypothetical protein